MRIQDLTSKTTIADTDLVVVDEYQSAGVYTTKKMTVLSLKDTLGLPSRYLYANISQTGTSAPTMTVVKNTLGYTPTFSYDGVGDYTMNFSESLSVNNTILTAGENRFPYVGSFRLSGGGVKIDTYRASTGANTDGVLVNASIKIEIYE